MFKQRLIILVVFVILSVLTIYYINNNTNNTKIKDDILTNNIQTVQDLVNLFPLHKNKKALCVRNNDKWESINYLTLFDLIYSFAKALKVIGVERESIAILGFNAPGWFISHLGTIYAGNISVGIYPTNSTNGVYHVLKESAAKVLVVENNQQFEKIANINNLNEKLPNLKYIISYAEPLNEFLLDGIDAQYIPLDQFIKIGVNSEQSGFNTLKPDDPITLIFTSGSTGEPKGVILTNRNIISNIKSIVNEIGYLCNNKENRIMSYLPLNHIASQMTDIYLSTIMGFEIYFPDQMIFKTTMVENLKNIKPTIFIGMPRIWQKLREGILKETSKSTLNNFAINYTPYFVHGTILKKIGLDKCKYAVTTSAPLDDQTRNFFIGLRLRLYDIYGMSETAGPMTISHPKSYKNGSVGKPLNSLTIKTIKDKIMVGGNPVFPGYIGNMRDKYWYDTGDLGKLDSSGYLIVNGRSKDIIITSGGENITPSLIEDIIKKEIPLVKDVILVGDKRKYLIALVTLSCSDDGRFTKETKEILNSIGSSSKTLKQASKDNKIKKYLTKQLESANKKTPSQTQTVKKLIMLSNPLTIENGELTPTLKVKRKIVLNKYAKLIDKTYSS